MSRKTITSHTVHIVVAAIFVCLMIAAAVAIIVTILTGVSKSFENKGINRPTSSPTSVPAFRNPPRAAVVARELHCKSFRDTGPGTAGLVIDSGVCYLNGHKYGLDTFLGSDVRDTWLAIAAKYGVYPKWESATAVVYPSVDPKS